jgi:ankyrin repeat protein
VVFYVHGQKALKRREEEILKILAQKTKMTGPAPWKDDSLTYAAEEGNVDRLQALLRHGASVDSKRRTYDMPAICLAAENGHTDIVNELASRGANVDAVNVERRTALIYASMYGHLGCVNILAGEYNANVQAVDRFGYTALSFAIENGHLEVVNALIGTHKASVEAGNIRGEDGALFIATQHSNSNMVDIINALINTHNADVEAVSWDLGWTPLAMAAFKDHVYALNALVAHGANVNARDDEGQTPLMIAAERNNVDSLNALVAHGAIIEATDHRGMTALVIAAQYGSDEIVEVLAREHGANPSSSDNSGNNALMCAAEGGHLNIVRILAGTYHVNVDDVNDYGLTALMLAVTNGYRSIVDALVNEYSADVNIVANGKTALMLAVEDGTEEIVAVLRQYQTSVVEDHPPTEMSICSVCQHFEPAIAFVPCGHTSCGACSEGMRRGNGLCHVCREPVEKRMTIFL